MALIGAAALSLHVRADDQEAESCSFACPAEGIEWGNGSITGEVLIDGYFRAVIRHGEAGSRLADRMAKHIQRIAHSVGIEPWVDDSPLGPRFQQAVRERFELQGDLQIAFEPPGCAVLTRTCASDGDEPPGYTRNSINVSQLPLDCRYQHYAAAYEAACDRPRLTASYQLRPDARAYTDRHARYELQAWLHQLEVSLPPLLGLDAEAELYQETGRRIAADAEAVLEYGIEVATGYEEEDCVPSCGSMYRTYLIGSCMPDELAQAPWLIESMDEMLQERRTAVASLRDALAP